MRTGPGHSIPRVMPLDWLEERIALTGRSSCAPTELEQIHKYNICEQITLPSYIPWSHLAALSNSVMRVKPNTSNYVLDYGSTLGNSKSNQSIVHRIIINIIIIIIIWSRAPRWLPRVSLFTLSKFV